MATAREKQQEFERLIQRLEREFEPDFIREVNSLIRQNVSIRRLTELLEAGNIAEIERIIRNDIVPLIGSEVIVPEVATGIAAGSSLAIAQDASTVGLITFDPRTPVVERFIEERTAELVVAPADVPEVRRWVGIAQGQGKGAEWTATQIRSTIGLHPQYANAVINRFDTMIAAGVDPDRAAKIAREYAAQLLRTRARTIARTELGRAAGTGRQASWDQAIAQGFLDARSEKRWATARDDKVGKDHQQMEGVKVPVQSEWLTPNGNNVMHPTEDRPNCRCDSVLVPYRRTRSV